MTLNEMLKRFLNIQVNNCTKPRQDYHLKKKNPLTVFNFE